MNRFPEKYDKPKLISLDEGLNTGWSAVCEPGAGASTSDPRCEVGHNPGSPTGDFIDPEILQQGL